MQILLCLILYFFLMVLVKVWAALPKTHQTVLLDESVNFLFGSGTSIYLTHLLGFSIFYIIYVENIL